MDRNTWNRLPRYLRREYVESLHTTRGGQHKADFGVEYNARIAELVAKHAENGKVVLVWHGRDCDGSRYRGVCRTHPAIVRAIRRSIKHTLIWADGPCDWQMVSPTEAKKIEESHRDLALEAYENGHSHVLYD